MTRPLQQAVIRLRRSELSVDKRPDATKLHKFNLAQGPQAVNILIIYKGIERGLLL